MARPLVIEASEDRPVCLFQKVPKDQLISEIVRDHEEGPPGRERAEDARP